MFYQADKETVIDVERIIIMRVVQIKSADLKFVIMVTVDGLPDDVKLYAASSREHAEDMLVRLQKNFNKTRGVNQGMYRRAEGGLD